MFYVYHLVDPRSDEVFYVGKGQRNRILEHEKEARRGGDHPKCDVIRSIWDDGLEVKRIKVRQFKDEREAYDFEALEIARIGLHRLTNLQAGGGTACGNKSVEPIYAARVLLKYLARVLKFKAAGHKLNQPWQAALEAMLPHTLSRLLEKFGEQFLTSELAKHHVEVSFSKVDEGRRVYG
jgi:hypothetical protein